MLSALRGSNPPRTKSSHLNRVEYEDGKIVNEYLGIAQPYFLRQHFNALKSNGWPPLHLHMNQDEKFILRAGTLKFVVPNHPDPSKRTTILRASDNNARTIFIPKRQYHTFSDYSEPGKFEPSTVDFRLDEQKPGMEEGFFRNFLGYVDDCYRVKQAPSLFQLMLFLHGFECPIAIPIPGPIWLKARVSCFVTWFGGVVIGKWILGYQEHYAEYYSGLATGEEETGGNL